MKILYRVRKFRQTPVCHHQLCLILSMAIMCFVAKVAGAEPPSTHSTKVAFAQADAGTWGEIFSDPCTGDWKDQWFLDGEIGRVKTGMDGMTLTAGPEFRNDAHHMVLWTKQSFEGVLKIDYDYTRLDQATNCVTILYIQATGSGEGPYEEDIFKWRDLRKVPSMKTYFNHMNTYHISYAAFPNSGEDRRSYIRGRRYMPEKEGLKGSELEPDYYPEGLFETGIKHHITVIKRARDLYMSVDNPNGKYYFHMHNAELPVITEGRIGLRHMFTRSARYQNFSISVPGSMKAGEQTKGRYADYESLVAETHKASLALRDQALRKSIAKDSCWPPGIWGDNLWTLAALQLNEKVEEANLRLLRQAEDYIEKRRLHRDAPAPTPEKPGEAPWTFFSITDYVRTLCLFHSKSLHFPGRLKPETEAAMKEALWLWVRGESRIADAGLDDMFLLLGTENHDLNKRPNYYLVTALLSGDSVYRNRKLVDGHTVAEHAAVYTAFFQKWPRSRAGSGVWAEVGSNTYQKYSWLALFNLHELAPDPVIRKQFGLLLDLAFIEEAQISVGGRRGGGRSRAYYNRNAFESYKNLLYAPDGQAAGSTHSRVIESSRYQLPAAAILLRKRTFPATEPFVIRNRVLGESEPDRPEDAEGGQRLAADPALVNYAYRTPDYLLGCTLQNPALVYAGISRQNRTCGLLFDDPSATTISQIHPVAEHTGGGRSQHSFWSVQHENVLLLQRIAARKEGGSYHTGRLGMRFEGADLQKIEEHGWIFATNGKAFVGVKFLDGGYQWDDKQEEVFPASHTGPGDTTRILLHAGDVSSHGSFARFREMLHSNPLVVTTDTVDYRFTAEKGHLEMNRYDAASPEKFSLPRINGKTVDLHPPAAFQSPYLNGEFGSARISVTVGPVKRVLDFSEQER